MKKVQIVLAAFASFGIMSCQQAKNNNSHKNITPLVEKKAHKLVSHGETRNDDYFWLRLSSEQKNAKNPDTQTKKVLNYLSAENDYLKKELQHTEELQEKLFKEITGRIKEDDTSVPYFLNGYWYYTRYEKGKEYPIYCRKQDKLKNKEEILLDANERAKNHKYYDVSGLTVSPNNKILAFAEDVVSRRHYTYRFYDLEAKKFLDETLENTTGEGVWANDNKTFFFTTKNPTTLLSEKIYRYTLGEKERELVYQEKNPSYYIGVSKSKSKQYIIIWESSTLSSDYHILDANNPKGKFKQFSPREDNVKYSIEHFENKFYIVTNWNAPNYQLMETSEKTTEKNNWKEIIANRKDVFLEEIAVFKNYLVLDERKNGLPQIKIIDNKTKKEHLIPFKEKAYYAGIDINPEFDSETLRFVYSSLTTPETIYDYDLKNHKKTIKKEQVVLGGYNKENYETKRFFAKSRDGKQIPISVVYKKGLKLDSNSPLLLYAYGSYGSTVFPNFRTSNLSLLDRGFAYAIAHVRGGQLLGREWYEDGKMLNKKNTFFDYIDCAKHLIKEKYTSSEKIFAMGGSAGGLLMGAVLNYEPTLFKGVIAQVPFVDVVTTMEDSSIPLTTNEYDEWGNPTKKEYYEYMKSYSPYDNVETKDYTNVLVTTGLHDSQVQYWEPAKWVAKLREMKTDNNKLYLHTNMAGGHGGASGRFEYYREVALEYAFMLNLINQ